MANFRNICVSLTMFLVLWWITYITIGEDKEFEDQVIQRIAYLENQVQNLSAKYKTEKQLRLEYQAMVDQTIHETIIIGFVFFCVVVIIMSKNLELKKSVEDAKQKCNQWKMKYENAINEVYALKDQHDGVKALRVIQSLEERNLRIELEEVFELLDNQKKENSQQVEEMKEIIEQTKRECEDLRAEYENVSQEVLELFGNLEDKNKSWEIKYENLIAQVVELKQQNKHLETQYQVERNLRIILEENEEKTLVECQTDINDSQVPEDHEDFEILEHSVQLNTGFLMHDLIYQDSEEQMNKLNNDYNEHESVMLLFDLCEKGDLDQMKPLLLASNDKNPLDPNNTYGTTLFHHAAILGRLEIVQYLIPLLKDKNPKNEIGSTPLHYAALLGHKEVVKYLLTQVDDAHPINDSGRSPWCLAIEKGHTEVGNILRTSCELKSTIEI